MTPYHAQGSVDAAAILQLIRTAFAYMDGRIDPPSSMHRLTEADIVEKARSAEVWLIGAPPVACVFLTPRTDALYIGKLAVAADQRGKGLARALITTAEKRAQALGLGWLELETRVELIENQATFRALGFHETGRSAHAGYDRPTSVTFRKAVRS